jgi:ABC-type Zn uptake system ZnuABC Zn-binding protein ZnuA
MHRRAFHTLLTFSLLALVSATGCDRNETSEPQNKEVDSKPLVISSTTMLADMVDQIAGDHVRSISIVSPGADPHLYRPTPRDARRIAESDLVVKNGLSLEGWMDDLIANAGGDRPIVTASNGVSSLEDPTEEATVDPHFWFDPTRWQTGIDNVSSAIQEIVSQPVREDIERRTAAYKEEIADLAAWVERMVNAIPEPQRVLVTSHDAFNYFGDRYAMEVIAIQGISTEEEASQRDVANVIETVKDTGVRAVFVESSVNPRMIEQVARETGAAKAGPLFSDSTGAPGTDAATYVGMVEENVRMIVEALGGKFEPRVARVDGAAATASTP